ncbi:Ephrin type-A receptor 4a [Balamuthia mandrillaris]
MYCTLLCRRVGLFLFIGSLFAVTIEGQPAVSWGLNYAIGEVRSIGPGRSGMPADEYLFDFPASVSYLGKVDGDLHAIIGGAPSFGEDYYYDGAFVMVYLNDTIRVEKYELVESPKEEYRYLYGTVAVPLTDINSDNKLDVAIVAEAALGSTFAYIYSMESDGTIETEPRLILSPTEEPLSLFPPFSEDYWEWVYDGVDVPADLAYLGDLDGDGVGDIVLSCPYRSNNYQGEVYVLYMNDDLTIKDVKTISSCSNCSESGGYDGYGYGSYSWGYAYGREVDVEDVIPPWSYNFGNSITGLGDFDGDNIPDLVVGMNGADSFKGAVYILLLNRNATVKALHEISVNEPNSLFNLSHTDMLGNVVRNLGNEGALTEAERFGPSMDFNHDNVPDLVVTSGYSEQNLWVLFLDTNGRAKGLLDLSRFDLGLDYGKSFAPAGDLNGDEIPDFLVGNPRSADFGRGTIDILLMSSITVNVSSTSLNLPEGQKRQSTASATFVIQVSSQPLEDILVPFSIESTSGIDSNDITISVASPILFTENVTSVEVEVTFLYPENSVQEEGLRLVLQQPNGAFLQQGHGVNFLVVVEAPSDSQNEAQKGDSEDEVGAEVIAPVVVVCVLLLLLVVAIVVAILFVRRSRRSRKDLEDDMHTLEAGESQYQAPHTANREKRKAKKKAGKKGDQMQNWFIDRDELEFIKEIGQGAFGVVWKGLWRETEVAIKKLHTMDDEQLSSFQHEAQLMRTLRPHPNVVQLMGLVEEDGLPECIVTEFLTNGDLLSFLRKKDDLSGESMIAMAFDVAAGMAHLHAEGITHRDLAARNLLMTEDLKIKVSDFGLSRKLKLAGAEQKTKQEVGPLKWMAPEAIQESIYSEKSDVWSYGVCLWEIVTLGQEPFGETHVMKAAVKVCKEGCKALKIPKGTPEILKDIMLACWKMDPKDRPTFDEITKQLQSASA